MRASNAEWDFMGRTFLVWSLANMGLREPRLADQFLPVMDEIIQETVKLEKEKGIYVFLMPYARQRPFQVTPARSLFLDGEIALMMGARRMLRENDAYKQPMSERLNLMEQRLRSNPLMAAESYPNECWVYDHLVALVAFKLGDRLDGGDHSALCRQWLGSRQATFGGYEQRAAALGLLLGWRSDHGPEGSTIWHGGALSAGPR